MFPWITTLLNPPLIVLNIWAAGLGSQYAWANWMVAGFCLGMMIAPIIHWIANRD